jgi:hypothetical protein
VPKRDRSPEKPRSTRGPEGPAGSGARAALYRSLLAEVTDGVERQRAAVLAQDSAAIAHAFEALAPLLTDLSLVVGTADNDATSRDAAAHVASMARQLREQIQTNQMLIANGIAIADHYALCVAEASPTISPALFSEVA